MEISFIVLLLTLIFTIGIDGRICWFATRTVSQLSVQQNAETSDDHEDEIIYDAGVVRGTNQTCSKTTHHCFALWKEIHRNNSGPGILIIGQGCWESSGKQDCDNIRCVTSRKPPKALNDTNFCCCKENFCNGNMTQLYYPEDADVPSVPREKIIENWRNIPLVFLLVFFAMTVTCLPIFIIIVRGLADNTKSNNDNGNNDNDNDNDNSIKVKFHSDLIHLMGNRPAHDPKFTCESIILEEILGQGRYGAVWRCTVKGEEMAVKIFQAQHKNYFYNELDIYCTPLMVHPSLLSYFGYDERIKLDGNHEYMLFLSLVPNGNLQEFLTSNVIDLDTLCKMCLSIVRGIAHLHSNVSQGGKTKPCICHRDLNTKNVLVREDLSCVICDLGFSTKTAGSKYYCNGEEQCAEIKSINEVGTLRYMSPEVLEGAVNLRDCETALKQVDVYALGLVLWEIATRCKDFYPMNFECVPYRLPFEAEIGHPTFEQMQLLVCKHKARPLFPDLWKDSPVIRAIKETIEDCWDQDAEARLTALCVEERFNELSSASERQKVSLYSAGGNSINLRTFRSQIDSQNVLMTADNPKEGKCGTQSTMNILVGEALINEKKSNQFHRDWSIFSVQPYQGRNPCLERNLMVLNECDSDPGNYIDKSRKCNTFDDEKQSSEPPGQNLNLPFNVNRSDPPLRASVPIPFLQNVKLERPSQLVKESNLTVENTAQNKMIGWANWRKIFGKKKEFEPLSPLIDCDVKSNLIFHETRNNLTSPVISSTAFKLETQVSLHNGKPLTRVNIEPGKKASEVVGVRETEMGMFEFPKIYGKFYDKRLNSCSLGKKPLHSSRMHFKSSASLAFSDSNESTNTNGDCKLLGPLELSKKTTTYSLPNTIAHMDKEEKFCVDSFNMGFGGDKFFDVKMRSESRTSLNDDRLMSGLAGYKVLKSNDVTESLLSNSFEDIAFSKNA